MLETLPSEKEQTLSNEGELKKRGERTATGKRAVFGTGNSMVNGRKMKSPPVDIFVWGLPKDTVEEDIVLDLAASGIIVNRRTL